MRGKGSSVIFDCVISGITPAYAGKRLQSVQTKQKLKDHPRLCGEKSRVSHSIPSCSGSPPPMRGKGYLEPFYSIYHRITPAYAGKRRSPEAFRGFLRDHPRLCGEKADYFGVTTDYLGSPPPMRGKAGIAALIAIFVGITPAYAGKSCQRLRHFPACRDHPRLCGEKFSGIWENIKGVGSPPPMRGKDQFNPERLEWCRITPAYAGKSYQSVHWRKNGQDHPRLCGEKSGIRRNFRGKFGITPAYAGKSST